MDHSRPHLAALQTQIDTTLIKTCNVDETPGPKATQACPPPPKYAPHTTLPVYRAQCRALQVPSMRNRTPSVTDAPSSVHCVGLQALEHAEEVGARQQVVSHVVRL